MANANHPPRHSNIMQAVREDPGLDWISVIVPKAIASFDIAPMLHKARCTDIPFVPDIRVVV